MVGESTSSIRRALGNFELRGLFVEELGWEPHADRRYVGVESVHYELNAVAHKRGMVVYTHVASADDEMPDSSTRRKIERQLAKHVLEHFIVYANADKTSQVWQWVKREPGLPAVTREQGFTGKPTESLVQRLAGIAFTLDEEDRIGLPDVWGRVQASFDVERVTKRFYDLFKKEHDAFLGFIQGLEDAEDCRWYASIMLNRLMFVYFIQRKGFLDGNQNYLRDKLRQMQSDTVEGNFLTFYRRFLLRLFHEGLGKDQEHRSSSVDEMIGRVPYLNGGIFDVHELEESNPGLDVPDEAFERIFDFFDGYRWHLDERPLREDNEINPDVLGYIFEKYINQKQMGAYYTQEDVTGYITQNAVIPYLFDSAREGCAVEFESGSAMWSLLSENPDRYIYEAVLKGVDEPLPEEIAAGVNDVSERRGWNRPADEEYALPRETWREHVARRQRCEELRRKLSAGEIHEINDLVTLNLNIRQLAQDAIASADGPGLVGAFYASLRDVSVLDPTCGSGAFLFAALNVLEPLYEACLERMQRFVVEDASGEGYTDFRRVLFEMGRHPSQRYFILKSIMVNNLYGVDIMEEAVEIARLRLFLKLMAQVESESEIEPLPDLDFNLRAGNTLVGFSTLNEVHEARASKLDFENSRERIKARASEASDAFQVFRWMQTEQRSDSEELGEAKAEVRVKLKELNQELDHYLASEYSVDPNDAEAFKAWRESHQPFHWVAEFYGIVRAGGFNVTLGNPPYVEYKRSKINYEIIDYRTLSCGNLWAYVLERSRNLLQDGGRMSLIVPLSLVSAEKMLPALELLEDRGVFSSLLNLSGDAHPSVLFSGVKMSFTIFTHKVGSSDKPRAITSKLYRWLSEERPVLFPCIQYEDLTDHRPFGLAPKVGHRTGAEVFKKITSAKRSIRTEMVKRSANRVLYHRIVRHFVKAMITPPYFWNERDGTKKSDDYKELFFDSKENAEAARAMLLSSVFYYRFLALSDSYHCGRSLVTEFPADLAQLTVDQRSQLSTLGQKHEMDLFENSRRRRIKYKATGWIEYDEFYPRLSKQIVDEIDRVLAEHYGFTDEELDFIINYDIKYRMGAEST